MKLHFALILSMLLLPAVALAEAQDPAPPAPAPRIAILASIWTDNTHANVIATKFVTGFPTDDGLIPPSVEVVSIYVDQPREGDVASRVSEHLGVPIFATVREALTLGGDSLAVDGVLFIGEHGDYPRSRLGARMYPRIAIFEQIFTVFETSGRAVPVFCDKQLAYSWLDAKWIYDRARELKAPLMGGSVIPLSWREPRLVHPLESEITEAVAVGYGPVDSYGFHALEVLQAMLERRKGGETGVTSIEALRGPAVYEAAREGKFSLELVEQACSHAPRRAGASIEEVEKNPTVIIVNYRDGTKGAVFMATRYVGEYWGYAARVDGTTVSCEFKHPPKPIYAYFSYLGLNAQRMFQTGSPQWPIERTLLTSGMLDSALRSLAADGAVIRTPHLRVRYRPFDSEPIWPATAEPSGASIGPWPPEGFDFLAPQPRRPARAAQEPGEK